MAFPMIPVILASTAAGWVGVTVWYYRLTNQDKDRYNEKVTAAAWDMFKKNVEDLSASEAEKVLKASGVSAA